MSSSPVSLLKTVLQVVVMAPIIGTFTMLITSWVAEVNVTKITLEGVLLFPLLLSVSILFGYIIGFIPALIAGLFKHYLMEVKKFNAIIFSIFLVLIWYILRMLNLNFELNSMFLAPVLLNCSLATGLIYVWGELLYKRLKSMKKTDESPRC